MNLRLTEALRFTNNDHVIRDIPAGMTAKLVPEDVFNQSPPYGGAFADLLIPYLAQSNSTLFGNKPDEARAVLPPPLVREGERVQPSGCTSSCSTRSRCGRRRRCSCGCRSST